METICGSQRLKKPKPQLAQFGKKLTSRTSWRTMPQPASARHTHVRFHARRARYNDPRWPGAYRTALAKTQGGADAKWHPPPSRLHLVPGTSRTFTKCGSASSSDATNRRGRRPGRCWSAWPGAARETHPWARIPWRRGSSHRPRWLPSRSERSRPRS